MVAGLNHILATSFKICRSADYGTVSLIREDSQIDFFLRNVLWTFGEGGGFCPVTFLQPLKNIDFCHFWCLKYTIHCSSRLS